MFLIYFNPFSVFNLFFIHLILHTKSPHPMKNLFFFPTAFLLFFFYTSQIYSQEMTVFLGLTGYQYYEDDRRLITAEVNSLLSDNELAFTYWKRSRTYNTIAFASSAIAVGTAIAIVTRDAENPASGGLYAASIGTTLMGLILTLSAHNQKKKTVLSYNKGLEHRTVYKITPIGNRNGLGLALKF